MFTKPDTDSVRTVLAASIVKRCTEAGERRMAGIGAAASELGVDAAKLDAALQVHNISVPPGAAGVTTEMTDTLTEALVSIYDHVHAKVSFCDLTWSDRTAVVEVGLEGPLNEDVGDALKGAAAELLNVRVTGSSVEREVDDDDRKIEFTWKITIEGWVDEERGKECERLLRRKRDAENVAYYEERLAEARKRLEQDSASENP